MTKFQFNPDQIEMLNLSKNSLNSELAKQWNKEEENAEIEISKILNDQKFINGEDLPPEKLDELFSYMKSICGNRNLSNLLYKDNLAKEFNKQLRNLIHGTGPFPKRVNDFFSLKNIGEQTLSQFLVAFDSKKYPLITYQTREILNLDSIQEDAALHDAIEIFNITNQNDFLERTMDYLTDFIIFETIKKILNLEKYTYVNNLLWFSHRVEEEGPEEIIKTFGSVSLEKDLRHYLADNPSKIEKGLSLVKEAFDTKDAGEIDILCKDKNGDYVVIETKKGRTVDAVVGQTLRYIGWIQKAYKTEKVIGIIIVNEPDPKLDFALIPIKKLIKLKYYEVNFEIHDKYNQK